MDLYKGSAKNEKIRGDVNDETIELLCILASAATMFVIFCVCVFIAFSI